MCFVVPMTFASSRAQRRGRTEPLGRGGAGTSHGQCCTCVKCNCSVGSWSEGVIRWLVCSEWLGRIRLDSLKMFKVCREDSCTYTLCKYYISVCTTAARPAASPGWQRIDMSTSVGAYVDTKQSAAMSATTKPSNVGAHGGGRPCPGVS